MKKNELEAKVLDIQQKLAALGDLNTLVQNGAQLPALMSQAQTASTTAQAFIPQLETQQQTLKTLVEEITALKTELASKSTDVDELTEKTTELQTKTDALRQETLTQLGLAASEKLSNSFEQVKDELVKEKNKWFYWLVGGVIALVAATGAIAAWQVHEQGSLYHVGFLIKIALTSPLVYFVVFVNREYSRVRNLIEEYTFKAAIARSFEAYKEILQDAFSEQQALVYKQKLDFILEAVGGLYSSPMRNVKVNNTKEKEISPDILAQIKDHIFPDIPKGTGQV